MDSLFGGAASRNAGRANPYANGARAPEAAEAAAGGGAGGAGGALAPDAAADAAKASLLGGAGGRRRAADAAAPAGAAAGSGLAGGGGGAGAASSASAEEDLGPLQFDFGLGDINMVELANREHELDFSVIDADLERFAQDPVIRDALARGVDLRQYSKSVDAELHSMEALSIADYIRESDAIAGLFVHISQCEAELTEMQKLLQGFQDNLGGISDEIKTLQDDSLALDYKITNRRALASKLRTLETKFFVSPAFIARITGAGASDPIDEAWLRHLRALSEKIEYCTGAYRSAATRSALATHAVGLPKPELPPEEQSNDSLAELPVNPMETAAGKEAFGNIDKLRQAAVGRIFVHLKAGIDSVAKKEKANIQRLQEHHLVKFAYAVAFLQAHGAAEAREVRKYYMDSMGAVYGDIFKKYAEDLGKAVLPAAAPGKGDVMGNFEAAGGAGAGAEGGAAGGSSSSSSSAGPRGGGDAFDIAHEARSGLVVEGTSAGCLDAPPLLAVVVLAEKQRMPWEAVFRSLQRHLLDVAGSEEFVLRKLYGSDREDKRELSREAKEVLAGALKLAVGAVWDAVEAHCNACWDAPGLLLTLALASLHKRGHGARGFKGMTAYADRIALLVWRRWKVVFEGHVASLKGLSAALGRGAKTALPPADAAAVHPLTQRFAHFKASVLFLHRTALMGAGLPIEDETLPKQLALLEREVEGIWGRLVSDLPRGLPRAAFLLNQHTAVLSALVDKGVGAGDEFAAATAAAAAAQDTFSECALDVHFKVWTQWVRGVEAGCAERLVAAGRGEAAGTLTPQQLEQLLASQPNVLPPMEGAEAAAANLTSTFRAGLGSLNEEVNRYCAMDKQASFSVLKGLFAKLAEFHGRGGSMMARAFGAAPPAWQRDFVTQQQLFDGIVRYARRVD